MPRAAELLLPGVGAILHVLPSTTAMVPGEAPPLAPVRKSVLVTGMRSPCVLALSPIWPRGQGVDRDVSGAPASQSPQAALPTVAAGGLVSQRVS